MKEIFNKTPRQLALEWDDIAEKRYTQITAGQDPTYTQVLCPLFTDAIAPKKYNSILDAGCGFGYLTHLMSDKADNIYGVDLSSKSISIANREYTSANITYICSDIISASIPRVDLCIANMFLMDCLDINETLYKIHTVLRNGGKLLCTIPNPMIMPRYWGYERYKWFHYQREIIIEADFRTSGQGQTNFRTTHVHRPISSYMNIFTKHGFKMVSYREITGNPLKGRVIKNYPRHLFWELLKA